MLLQDLLEKIQKNEELALILFKNYRLYTGLSCKKCGNKNHYWLASKNQFQCKKCSFRTTIRSGSIMESCKLPLSYFFTTMILLTNSDGKLSVEELQNATQHKYYEPIWSFLYKIKSFYTDNQNINSFSTFVNSINLG